MIPFVMRTFLTLIIVCVLSTNGYRLPKNVIPSHYRIDILTNLADLNSNFTFSGEVWIQIQCKKPTKEIVLHAKDLEIFEDKVLIQDSPVNSNRTLRNVHNNSYAIVGITYNNDSDFMSIRLSENLQENHFYKIYIPFTAELNSGLAGFYRSSYKDLSTGETKWLAVTQFESIDARRAFPCFDEPALKARFEISLGHINTKTAVSNMPIARTDPIEGMNGWVWDRFDETVPMSTYLVAFLVSDFKYVASDALPTNNIHFRTWARKDALSQVKFASEIGPKVLEDYEIYFGIKYPLPKQDMVAVPDFSAGAMENWGLITYRETTLLYDENFTSPSTKSDIAEVIAHEIAHQWFGNLVTMKWWTDLWLNEGFATYLASQETHKLFPEWNYENETVAENFMLVLSLDSLKSSHPISVPINHPREIPQIFDVISYKKGSFIIRMMNLFLGEDTFRSGISNYLRKHAFSNAEQDDLWQSLTEEAQKHNVLPEGLTVKSIMDTWTLKTGYPLLNVTRNYTSGEATIRQRRYFAENSSESSNSTWHIPITYTTLSELDFNHTSPKLWFRANESHVRLSNLSSNDWLLINVKVSGLYRVCYDQDNWNKLVDTLNSDAFEKIHVLNRVQLIYDSLHLAKSGEINYDIPFGILGYLKREEEFLPWLAASSGLQYFRKVLYEYPVYKSFQEYARSLILPIYAKTSQRQLDNIPSNFQQINFQNLILSWSCRLDIQDCIEMASEQFRSWMNQSDPDAVNPVPVNHRYTVYCYAIKRGGDAEWQFAWERYLKSNVGTHRSTLLRSLACTSKPWLLNRYLQWSINETSGVRRQDSAAVFSRVSRNDLGYYLAKNFLFSRIGDIAKYHGFRSNRLSAYMDALLSHVTNEYELNEYKDFIKRNEEHLQGAEKAVKQSLETAMINVQWNKRYYDAIENLLTEQLDKLKTK